MTVEDIRWRDVWGHIKPYQQTPEEFEKNLYADHTEVYVTIRFDGNSFSGLIRVSPFDQTVIPNVLDNMVYMIDELLVKHGVPPYKIESGV